jgi:coniferyl-aldehyde dehydrogenase
LTPVTLELGGKSPVILGPDTDIAAAASAIMSGKYRNAGQTCIAPDYLLLPPDRCEAFVAAARRIVMQRFPALLGNADYTTIVSDAQFDRLTALLDDARAQGATVVPLHDGLREPDRTSRTIPPLAVLDVHDGMRIMQTEIFGPILPILAVDDLDAAIAYVNAHPRPLALYYFGYDPRAIERVVDRTISGGVAINDTLVQYVQDDLPFGGIGASGMGHYHGRAGFVTFSKEKPVFEQSRRNGNALLEPPYTRRFDAILNVLMR